MHIYVETASDNKEAAFQFFITGSLYVGDVWNDELCDAKVRDTLALGQRCQLHYSRESLIRVRQNLHRNTGLAAMDK